MTTKANILFAEDDPNLGAILNDFLKVKGYDVTLCKDGAEALSAFSKSKYDLCILDVMMPILDGFSAAREMKNNDTNIPIIFLTAKSLQNDKIEGLKIGADDYITKPFNSEELFLRIENILKRTHHHKQANTNRAVFSIGGYTFDFNQRVLIYKTSTRKLTSREAELLRLLCEYKNDTLPRVIALKQIWNEDNYFTSRSMDVFITKLRAYLKEDNKVEIINVHGTGFKLICC